VTRWWPARAPVGTRTAAGTLSRKAGAPAADQRWQRASRAGRRWAAWGVALGAVAGAVFNAPAQWLADGLSQGTGQRLLLADARGSLWNGSAALVLTGGAGSRDASVLPGRLQWRLRPGWRGLQLTASQACCLQGDLQLLLQPQWGGYTVVLAGPAAPAGGTAIAGATAHAHPATAGAGTLGQWPAAWLAGLGTPWNTLQLGGVLQVASPGLELQSVQGRWRLAGGLTVELLDASSRLSSLPQLGSYRLQLKGTGAAGEAATLRLDSLSGALQLSGSGQWNGAGLRFRGEARAAEAQGPALSNLLNIIGRRQGALSVISIG
jgi:general secretion pathway protein N